MTTNELTRATLSALEDAGCVVTRLNAGRVRYNVRMAPKGWPDIVGYTPRGQFVGAEIKGPDDELRDDQREWLDRALRCKCCVHVIENTEDIEFLVDIVTKW